MCFAAGWNGFAGRIWPAGRSLENPDDIEDDEEWWQHIFVGVQHPRLVVVI